ncbi:MAG: S9 family peptidase [Elusimicrobia bacterium]|nr:S9 family peptidase [Elusimicrobiota bacterium]
MTELIIVRAAHAVLAASLAVAATLSFPVTPKRPVADVFHGVKIAEDYRWLESGDSAEVKAWTLEQNAATRAYLDKVPARADAKEKIAAYYKQLLPSYDRVTPRPGAIFAMKFQPPKNQPLLVVLASPDDLSSERVILDPNVKQEKGLLSIDWYKPSLDGKRVAVAMSEKGSEDGSLYFFDVETAKPIGEAVPRVQYPTGGGSAAWTADGGGVYYTRYPQGEERPKEDRNFYQQIYFHKLGTPASSDAYVLGKDFPRIAEIGLDTSDDGRFVLAIVANGDGGEYALHLMRPDKTWAQLSRFEDKVVAAEMSPSGDLFLLSRKGAPRGQVLRLDAGESDLAKARLIVKEGKAALEGRFKDSGIAVTRARLYVTALDGGPSQVQVYDHDGKLKGAMPLPDVSAVLESAPYGDDGVLVRAQTYLEPAAWFRYDGATVERTAMVTKAPVDFSDAEVVREFAASKDGTKVPMSIIRRKGTILDGRNPVLLTGYGGYGNSLKPRFLAIKGRLFLDKGGIVVVANIRGGGEYGEEWHRQGNLDKKQNVFDDFIAVARHLVERKYASPSTLAIEGGSNGGLLMGAALTQRPDLFRAVVAHVGLFDMLRVELHPNGAFNVTEFGTVKDPEQFKALRDYSPYHNVKDGTTYPSVFFLTGEHDGRVDPMNSRKMAARLQASGSKNPVYLRVSMDSGHGIGTALSERIEQDADVFAFLDDQLGLSRAATR